MGIQSVMASDLSDDLNCSLADSNLDVNLVDSSSTSNLEMSEDFNSGLSEDPNSDSSLDSSSDSHSDKIEDSNYIHDSAKNKLSSDILESNTISSNVDSDIGSVSSFSISSTSGSSNLQASSPKVVIIKSANNYHSLNSDIQSIINSSSSGSTIKFIGTSYNGLYLKINKPLNIISECGTVIHNTENRPAFDLSSGATGTNITGFTLDLAGSFVEANGVSKITISGNTVKTTGTAIIFRDVFDSKIANNKILKFKTGLDISKSGGISISKNYITPVQTNSTGIKLKNITSKKGINILDNKITGKDMWGNEKGIIAYNVSNLYLKGNVLSKLDVGMDIPDSLNNFTLYNNTFSSNWDGLVIGGWVKNFSFTKNTIVDNGHLGVYFTDTFHGYNGIFSIEKNYFNTNGMDLRDKGDVTIEIGKNFASNRCARVEMKNTFKVQSLVNGNKASFTIVDKNGVAVSGLPNFNAKVTVNGKTYDVLFIEGTAYVDVGKGGSGFSKDSGLDIAGHSNGLGKWGSVENVGLDDILYYSAQYQELLGNSNNDTQNDADNSDGGDDYEDDDSGNEQDSNSTSSSKKSHSSDGRSSVSSSSSSQGNVGDPSSGSSASNRDSSSSSSASVGSQSSSSPSSSASSGSQSPSDSNSPSAVKTLSVDDETFRVIGVGGLVFLILVVIGFYYREDIKNMIENK